MRAKWMTQILTINPGQRANAGVASVQVVRDHNRERSVLTVERISHRVTTFATDGDPNLRHNITRKVNS
jgi:hypothetical protein